MNISGFRKVAVLAGIAALGTVAQAFYYDATIAIERALTSPTLTIRYTGAYVAMVELRLNGKSLGTRTVVSSQKNGETNFNLDLTALADGENQVEIRLYDKSGKIVGSRKTTISADDTVQGPIFLSAPKIGATVQGPVEIKLGFGKEMRNVYASFFVNNQFRSMINTPPFTYIWDSTRETNGWHELEAWVVDEGSSTFKTRRVRVFVNNPGGRTDRKDPVDVKPTDPVVKPVVKPVDVKPSDVKTTDPVVKPVDVKPTNVKPTDPVVKPKVDPKEPTTKPVILDPVANPGTNPGVTGGPADTKPVGAGSSKAVDGKTTTTEPTTGGVPTSNPVRGSLGQAAGMKPADLAGSTAAGAKHMTPTGTRTVATAVKTNPTQVVSHVTSAAGMVSITKGTRLPNLPTFSILLNNQYMDFDVNPRVQGGVPLTPFRHLIEKSGGEVDWESISKSIDARSDGRTIFLRIGDELARINDLPVRLELAPFIEKGRTIVPLSFIRESLDVEIDYDPSTGHVLITSKKK